MRYFYMAIILLHVLEALQLQRKNHRQLFDSHPLLRLLVRAAVITLKFIITTEGFSVAEASQAMRNRRVLINVDLEIEEVFVFAADGLAVETSSFAGEDALEDFVHPGRLGAGGAAVG